MCKLDNVNSGLVHTKVFSLMRFCQCFFVDAFSPSSRQRSKMYTFKNVVQKHLKMEPYRFGVDDD